MRILKMDSSASKNGNKIFKEFSDWCDSKGLKGVAGFVFSDGSYCTSKHNMSRVEGIGLAVEIAIGLSDTKGHNETI